MAFSLSSIHYRLSDRNDTPEPHWVALLLKKGSVPLTYNPKPAGKYHSELDYRFWLGNLKKKLQISESWLLVDKILSFDNSNTKVANFLSLATNQIE